MSGTYTAERVAATIDAHGDAMVLSRTGEASTISLNGKLKFTGIEDVGRNTAAQRTVEIRISDTAIAASAWAVKVPKRGDKIADTEGGRTYVIDFVDTRKDGAVTVLHVLHAAG